MSPRAGESGERGERGEMDPDSWPAPRARGLERLLLGLRGLPCQGEPSPLLRVRGRGLALPACSRLRRSLRSVAPECSRETQPDAGRYSSVVSSSSCFLASSL